MSRGSTFTLYRAYNKFKIGDSEYSKILTAYHDYNKRYDCGFLDEKLEDSEKMRIEKEREEKWTNDVPLVMHTDFNPDYYDHDNKAIDLATYRKANYTNHVLRDDRRYCDKLLEWNFCSSFDNLVEHYNLNYYNFRDSSVLISKSDAKEMLVAIEYLLGGKWDDSIEKTMNNPWIKIFSEGGNCDLYWKYIYRNRNKGRIDKIHLSGSGIKVTVTLPKNGKKSEEDEEYAAELNESNENIEYYLRNVANALRAFIESDNWSYEDDTELVLEYSAWG